MALFLACGTIGAPTFVSLTARQPCTSGFFHIADDGLTTIVHMNVLDPEKLLPAVPQASKNLNLSLHKPSANVPPPIRTLHLAALSRRPRPTWREPPWRLCASRPSGRQARGLRGSPCVFRGGIARAAGKTLAAIREVRSKSFEFEFTFNEIDLVAPLVGLDVLATLQGSPRRLDRANGEAGCNVANAFPSALPESHRARRDCLQVFLEFFAL